MTSPSQATLSIYGQHLRECRRKLSDLLRHSLGSQARSHMPHSVDRGGDDLDIRLVLRALFRSFQVETKNFEFVVSDGSLLSYSLLYPSSISLAPSFPIS